MSDSGKLYYSIGEVAKMLDVNASQLRFWEREFNNIKPKVNSRGHRIYTADDIQELRIVQYLLKDKRMTIEGAKLHLKDKKHTFLENIAGVNVIDELLKIKNELAEIRKELNLFADE